MNCTREAILSFTGLFLNHSFFLDLHKFPAFRFLQIYSLCYVVYQQYISIYLYLSIYLYTHTHIYISTVIRRINITWAPNQPIRMISTELCHRRMVYWLLIIQLWYYRNKLHFIKNKYILKIEHKSISQYCCFLLFSFFFSFFFFY